jgi:regulator of protease activity HflC (stomatin/prohibitin superfamily)
MDRGTLFLLLVLVALAAWAWFGLRRRIEVLPGEVALLYRDGRFERELEPGVHRWFDPSRRLRMARISLLPQSLGQHVLEVISRDQFAFRLTLAPLVTVTDARAFHEAAPRPPEAADRRLAAMMGGHMQVYDRLHPVMASGALQAVARHTLEELLADPANALESVAAEVATVLPGTRLDAIKVTAITLPPETRKMFTEAERARRQGLAALERARGEQASLRALANAARNLANNPELARLRTLQTMESAQGAKTFILGELPREVGLPERN